LFVLMSLAVAAVVAQATPAPHRALAQAVPVASASPEVTTSAAPGSTTFELPPVPVIAPTYAPPAYGPNAQLVGTAAPFVGLTLTDAIGMALARNTDLNVSQSNRRIAGYQVVAAQGAYDLQFMIQPNYSYAQTPAVSVFEAGPNGAPSNQTTFGANGQLSANLPGGGNFSVTSSASRVNSNLTLNSYDPYYQTALALNFTQPLGRGAGIDDNRRQLYLARINVDQTNDTTALGVSNTISTVLDAYYDLVSGWKNVGIQEDALRQARAQSQSNARLVKQGASAPVDVVESDTQVDVYQNSVASAVQNVASLQNRLKQLVLNNPGDPLWMANLVPVSPSTDVPDEPKLDDVIAAAIAGRPELAQLRDSMRSSDVNVAYAKEQRKPLINLNLSAGLQGLAGTLTNPDLNPFTSSSALEIAAINALVARVNSLSPPGSVPLQPISIANVTPPAYTVGGLGQAYSNMFQGKFPQYSVSATIGFPLRDRTAEAQYQVAVEQRRQLVTQEVGLIQRVEYEARNALQAYRSARTRLLTAGAARRAAEAVEASEERKFRAGASTTFLVLQRQVNLATQRGSELQAQTDLQKARVELDRVTGDILTHNHVNLDTVGTTPLGSVPNLGATPHP
jgi:outer membrane protein TolC